MTKMANTTHAVTAGVHTVVLQDSEAELLLRRQENLYPQAIQPMPALLPVSMVSIRREPVIGYGKRDV